MGIEDCIFCKIASGEISAEKIYEDETVVAFDDIHPQAPTHFLVIPRKHIASLDEASAPDGPVISKMMLVAAELAREKGIAKSGYRQIINCGKEGGQVVYHLHLHILGGRRMSSMG